MREALGADALYEAVGTLKRMRTVMKTLVGQLDILETMTPLSFSSFRNRLDTASGFQSSQFRELEFAFGYKRAALAGPGSPIPTPPRWRGGWGSPRSWTGCTTSWGGRGVAIPPEVRAHPPEEPTRASEAVQDAVLEAYRTQPEMVFLFEALMDFDEGMQEWRYRHVKLVERTIGAKQGTGGSNGMEFLKASLFKPLFPDVWAVRHRM